MKPKELPILAVNLVVLLIFSFISIARSPYSNIYIGQ